MATEAMIDHSRALLQGNMDETKTCVEQLAAVDEPEAEYRLTVYVEVVTLVVCHLLGPVIVWANGKQNSGLVISSPNRVYHLHK